MPATAVPEPHPSDLCSSGPAASSPAPGGQALRIAPAPRCEPSAEPTRRAPLRLLRGTGATEPRVDRPVVRPVDPAALVGATRVLRLALEVEEGRRSHRQLATLLAPELLDGVRARTRVWPNRGEAPARLRMVHVQQVDADVAEAFAVVDRGPHSHAVAARLERRPRGWWCVALMLR